MSQPVDFAREASVTPLRRFSDLASPTWFERDKQGEPSSHPVDQTRKDNELREESDDESRRE